MGSNTIMGLSKKRKYFCEKIRGHNNDCGILKHCILKYVFKEKKTSLYVVVNAKSHTIFAKSSPILANVVIYGLF